MCASCSLHFYTCSRFSYFHAARTLYPTPLAFIFALFFAHIYLSACLQFGTLFFFSFVASRWPARTISKVPLRSNVLDKLKERKVKARSSSTNTSKQQGAGERQGCRCCTHLCLLHSRLPAKCRFASLALSPFLSLQLAIRDACRASLCVGALTFGANGGSC